MASLIWVTAWINETTNPTANPTISGGPASFIVTIMHSRITQIRRDVDIAHGSDRHLHDVLIGLHDPVTNGRRGLQGHLRA